MEGRSRRIRGRGKGRQSVDPAVEQVHRLKAALPLPDPWDLSVFVDRIGVMLGKPVRVIAQAGMAGHGFPCGLVVERTDDIVIIHESTGSNYHSDHIVLHEIAHLLLDHADTETPAQVRNAMADLLPECDPADVHRVLARTDYDQVQEGQAELFASLVMADSVRARPRSALRATFFRD